MIDNREALRLADALDELPAMMAEASARRDRAWGHALTFSPKVFLPLTNLCRNRCDYCSFRRSAGDAGEWTMTPNEVVADLDRAQAAGCIEALFCLGDTPESGFPSYRRQLASWGHDSTVDYLERAAEMALDRGLLPHTNAGVLSSSEMARLKRVNVSLGLMLENVSPRLSEPGMPHHRAPDKHPEVRLRMIREAGELEIPFTSGILVGIGETGQESASSLLALRDLHVRYGHLQEVIIQNFRRTPSIPMAAREEPEDLEIAHAVALARLIMPDEVGVQAPPNLNPASVPLLIRSGINDFGGISPLTPDYINPLHPWPHVDRLAEVCAEQGFLLKPRLPIYPRYQSRPEFVDTGLLDRIRVAQERLS